MNYFYGALVYAHVVSAVLAIGPLFLLLPIIKRLRRSELPYESAYLAIIYVTVRLVMHAGHVLVGTGVLLVLLGPWPWYTSWVIATLIVLLISGFFLATGFSKVLKNYYLSSNNKEVILTRLQRTCWIYIVLMLVMLWLMVQKPVLW